MTGTTVVRYVQMSNGLTAHTCLTSRPTHIHIALRQTPRDNLLILIFFRSGLGRCNRGREL